MPNALAVDLVWGEHGAAARIAASLAHVSRLALRGRDVDVTHYGARPCVTVAQTSPYKNVAKSPVSSGSELTTAPGAFDSRPAFLAAIDAQGPVAFDYDSTPPVLAVQPISGVTISNCDFGTPVASPRSSYACNVSEMTLTNVTIAGQAVNTTITDKRRREVKMKGVRARLVDARERKPD